VLTTSLANGTPVFLGVSDEINGVVNPKLYAEARQTITVTLINGGEGRHQIVFPGLKAKTGIVSEKGETTSVTFKIPEAPGELAYRDGNSAYEALGMAGVLVILEGQAAPVAEQPADPVLYTKELALTSFQKGGCAACHTIPDVPGALGTIGPDLGEIGEVVTQRIEAGEYSGQAKTVQEYLLEAIQSPDAFLSPACPSGPCAQGQMPASISEVFSSQELSAVVNFLAALPGGEIVPVEMPSPAGGEQAAIDEPTGEPPAMTEEEFTWAKQTFFERCAGCHGTLRNGATGPALTPDKTLPKGTVGLAAIIFNGTARGMPGWGTQNILTQTETETMAKFLQNDPPAPPELSLQR
jgi:nitrite reductase (NO-forming)/hydroxylamine reductase